MGVSNSRDSQKRPATFADPYADTQGRMLGPKTRAVPVQRYLDSERTRMIVSVCKNSSLWHVVSAGLLKSMGAFSAGPKVYGRHSGGLLIERSCLMTPCTTCSCRFRNMFFLSFEMPSA